MAVTIAVVGCLDTKGDELEFLARTIESLGARAWLVDTGVLGEASARARTSAAEVARAAGTTLEALRQANDRGAAVAAMADGAAEVVRELFGREEIQGIVGAGGSANTTIAAKAMRALPVGFPKVLVSTLASGDVSPWIDTKDIALIYSVVDIAGINRISARILTNAARAVVAMAQPYTPPPERSKGLIAATMFGVTTPCVTAARRILEGAGWEVLVFHATGTGGRAMEALIADGFIAGVLDITTTELADELVGGVLSAGPDRLRAAGRAGIPQVVSVGAVDMVNFGPPETVPERFRGRKLHRHNPAITLMRTTVDECAEIGRRIAERLSDAKGRVSVLAPLRGVSAIDIEGQPFHDPEAGRALRVAIRENLPPGISYEEIDTDINDPAFARRAAESLLAIL